MDLKEKPQKTTSFTEMNNVINKAYQVFTFMPEAKIFRKDEKGSKCFTSTNEDMLDYLYQKIGGKILKNEDGDFYLSVILN